MVRDTIFITKCRKIFRNYYAKTEAGDVEVQHYQKTCIILSAQGKRQRKDMCDSFISRQELRGTAQPKGNLKNSSI